MGDSRDDLPEEQTAFVEAFREGSEQPDIWADVTPHSPETQPETEAYVEDSSSIAGAGFLENSSNSFSSPLPVVSAIPQEPSEEDWVEEAEPEPEPYLGDGPFAVAMDGPQPGVPPSSPSQPARPPKPTRPARAASFRGEMRSSAPPPLPAIRIQRKTRNNQKKAAASPAAIVPNSSTPERHYPKMLALLSDPDSVPLGSEPLAPPLAPPVPGSFFPAAREPLPKAEPTDLDGLLSVMAEGLLIGEGPDGGSEVRVTLKDEFFAGTELRISINEGRIFASLYPPSRDIYFQLNGQSDALRMRLEERGLRVSSLEVMAP